MTASVFRYGALLRGINVGGHRVKMDHLRTLFDALGYADVQTLIASGNVIFSSDSEDSSALQAEIETHLLAELGYEVATFIRTHEELAAVVSLTDDLPPTAFDSESDEDPVGACYVVFLATLPTPTSAHASRPPRLPPTTSKWLAERSTGDCPERSPTLLSLGANSIV